MGLCACVSRITTQRALGLCDSAGRRLRANNGQVIHARVLLVEDEAFTRALLATSLTSLGFAVVGQSANSAQALAAFEDAGARGEPVEIALLDLDLGAGPSGIDLAYALRERLPNIGLIFLTSFSDPRIKDPSERALPRGARYLIKTALDDVDVLRTTLLQAVREPLKLTSSASMVRELTDNQMQVLKLVAEGRTNAEIALAMQVSNKAVERTISRVMEALSLDSAQGNPRVLLTRAYVQLSGKAMPS